MGRALLIAVMCGACGAASPAPVVPAAGGWTQRFVEHDGVRIEYFVRPGDDRTPILMVPGMGNSAHSYVEAAPLIAALGTRSLIALSLRSRGGSSAPATGYTLADHQRDILAVVQAEHLAHYHLLAHSMGVAYSIGYALTRPAGEIVSYVAADYFPAATQYTDAWAMGVEEGHDDPTVHRQTPRGYAARIVREQDTHDYSSELDRLAFPILVIFGTQSMDRFREAMWDRAPHHRVMWIEHGHLTFTSEIADRAIAAHFDQFEPAAR